MVSVCKHCNFKSDKEMSVCGYCERGDGIENEKDASQLLDDVDRLLHG